MRQGTRRLEVTDYKLSTGATGRWAQLEFRPSQTEGL